MGACVPKMMDEGKDNDQAVAACMTMWREHKSIDTDTLKIGARNSRKDAHRLQMIHDYARDNGADCAMDDKSIDVDTLFTFGAEVKALDGGKGGGFLVRFSSADAPDLTGDFFTQDTDFGGASHSDVYYQHGSWV